MSTTEERTTPSSEGEPTPPPPQTASRTSAIRPFVFWPALILILLVSALAIAFPEGTGEVLGTLQSNIIGSFGWYYVLIVAGFVVFALWMGLSRFGEIVLGKDDEEPEFSLMAWFSMLFAAGMGIGLVFWGAAEPLTFFENPKPGVAGDDAALAQAAMAQVFLHWGLHAWAIYVVVGLALAYAIHRKGRPVSIRWALEPLLGDRVKGWVGDVIDTVAIVGTVAGVATSLGLGVQQISSGLVSLGVFAEADNTLWVSLIVVITFIATLSVVSGIGRGIKWLSNTNLVLAAIFVLAIMVLGPTLFILRGFVENIGGYLRDVLPLSFSTSALTGTEGAAWQSSWTIFYWGWWMSWAPFVGVFIARISRGRTVRQFVAGVLLVPTLVTFLWFSVLGGTAIHRQMFGGGGLLEEDGSIVSQNVLFNVLDGLPLSGILTVTAIILVTIFFVTSSDSGSLVVTMLASGGNPDPPTWNRVLWATMEGLVAAGLLLAGGLVALQTGAIITALPFSLVMIAMCVATYKALNAEHRIIVRAERLQRQEVLSRAVGADVTTELTDHFDEHFAEPVEKHVEKVLNRKRGLLKRDR